METDTSAAKVMLAIPVYNEQKHLNEVLDKVGAYINDVVVIDDGSTDRSRMILAKRRDVCTINHPQNRGYGQSIIDAIHFATGCYFDWLITMDCDLQHQPAQIPDFLAAIAAEEADVISGSRYLVDCEKDDSPPADRQRINQQITQMVNEKLGLQLTDSFCGFKAVRLAAMEKLSLREPGYAIPLEFWVQVAAHGLRVREIPVRLIYNDPTRHFGGKLDDSEVRLKHYIKVFERACRQVGMGVLCEG